MRRMLLVAIAVAVGLAVMPAAADQKRVVDGNDTTGPLDIHWIKHAHRTNAKGQRQLVHTVRLYERWPVRRLRHRGYVHLFFQLRGHPGNPEERTLWIIYENGKLKAEMYNTLGDPPKYLRDVRLWRPDGRTVKVAFRKSLLRRRDFNYYKWGALSYIEGRHPLCGRSQGCGDFAPDVRDGKRYVRHQL